MGEVDDFLGEDLPIPTTPPDRIAVIKGKFQAAIERIMGRAAAEPLDPYRDTYACATCHDRGWVQRAWKKKDLPDNGYEVVWPCTKCEPGKRRIVGIWLDTCFPVDRFGKRTANRAGQAEFEKYMKVFPEQEAWLPGAIMAARDRDIKLANAMQERR